MRDALSLSSLPFLQVLRSEVWSVVRGSVCATPMGASLDRPARRECGRHIPDGRKRRGIRVGWDGLLLGIGDLDRLVCPMCSTLAKGTHRPG